MMARPRKRRPGGGRKPQGTIRGKSKTFATRLTPETREALEREASASGHSISQVAERLLILGLEEKRKRGANRPLRALCYVIEQIAHGASEGQYVLPAQFPDEPDIAGVVHFMNGDWRTEPFSYRAFKIAVGMLLDALEPKGEIRCPFPAESLDKSAATAIAMSAIVDLYGLGNPAVFEHMKSIYKSPESYAASIFSTVWARLNRAHDLSERELEAMRHLEWEGDAMREEFYGMAEARVDLLGSKGEDQ